MTKYLTLFLAVLFVFSLSACACGEEEPLPPGVYPVQDAQAEKQETPPAGMMLGGWNIPVLEGTALPEDAQAAFDKATGQLVGAMYTPVALMGTQLVAGTNYCILCQITPVVPDAVPSWNLVYIYADLEGNADITNIYELYIDRHTQP